MAKRSVVAKKRRKEASPKTRQLRKLPGARQGSPAELDGLIHQRMRLAIVSTLAVNKSLSFADLKQILETTDGNLSVHARKLEDAGYIACKKYFEQRVPKTVYSLTATGRHALERYLGHMEALIKATRHG